VDVFAFGNGHSVEVTGSFSRVGPVPRLVALGVALATSGVLLWLDPPGSAPKREAAAAPAVSATPLAGAKLTDTWPAARIVTKPGRLADGMEYTPWFHLTADISVGAAPTRDGAAERLLLRGGTGEPKELRRVAKDKYPQFLGFTAAGDFVYWAESTASVRGPSETRLWKANWRTGARPVSLTVDTGAMVFFNSQYDMVVAEGRLHWIAAAQTEDAITELRSVSTNGGRVTTRRITGAYAMSAWPWLVSVGGPGTPLELLNTKTNAKVRVPTSATELVGCSPVWCRTIIVAQDGGAVRFDLMKPDGSDRHRVAGGAASASVSDVALLDRFEVLSQGRDSASVDKVQLLLYDVRSRKFTLVGEGVGIVQARSGMLWWSTGDNEAAEWHALDLRTLP
jgi:hypothetical protein